MKKPKKILSVALCVLTLSPVCALGLTNNTNAVSLSDLNTSEVFVKQQESETCTLASNVMLLRRAAMLRGDSDWQSITESSCRSTLWCGGMRFSYTYKGISVDCERIYGNSTEKLKSLLSEHPEGIVAYDYDYPHAILLTDYTDGKFYGSDPARCIAPGRINAADSLIDTSDIEAYWYVTSKLAPVQELKNTSRLSTENAEYGKTVTIYGNVEGNNGSCKFTYQYKRSYNSSWKTISTEKTDKKSVTFLPQGVADYDIKVIAEDTSGNKKEKTMKLSVYSSITNKSSIDSYVIPYGKDMTLSLASEGGSGNYLYEVKIKKPSSENWAELRGYSAISALTYHPWESGIYRVNVSAKDKLTGSISSKSITFKVNADTLNNNTTVDKNMLTFGEDIQFTLSASGGTAGLNYDITVLKPSSKDWLTLKNSCKTSTFIYHPWESGTYNFKVTAKDNSGNTSEKTFSVFVNADPLQNDSSLKNNTVILGNDLVINTKAQGGTGSYKYDINIVKPNTTNWINVRKYNSCSVFNYHPWEKGIYKLCINVKDSSGNISSKYFTFNVV